MTTRRYGHYCAVARALDRIGERWSVLVIRELLDGPKRYTDLLAGLPGIATDRLAARLRELEDTGLISRRTLPPPAAAKVYELTALGRGLQPVLTELARWGLQLLGARRPDEVFQPHWLALPLRTRFHAERAHGIALTVQFDIDGDQFHARIADGTLQTFPYGADDPDVTVLAAAAALTAAAADPAAAGRLRARGSPDAITRVLDIFGLGEPARTEPPIGGST